ncbi:MAG: hypothetical protein HDT39_13635 [Lachnospiraceae bacterium]|nr:hypothetical protein [Lachnospiraceae bacterium]
MKNILWIGKYNKYGVFDSDNWNQFITWLKKNCDMVDIYSNINPTDIRAVFGNEKVMNEYVFEGMENYHSYEIACDDNVFNTLSMWNYNINICNISHIYFYLCEKELGYISINDFDNFVVFDFPNMHIDELVNMLNSVKENAEICFEYKYDIDGIVEDDWIPVGIEKKW